MAQYCHLVPMGRDTWPIRGTLGRSPRYDADAPQRLCVNTLVRVLHACTAYSTQFSARTEVCMRAPIFTPAEIPEVPMIELVL